MDSDNRCTIDGCGSRVFARGWCSKHYTRWQRHGDPTITVKNPPATRDATEKVCPRCSTTKAISEFGKRPNGNPKGYCRKCEAAYQRQHAASNEGREQRRLARARWNESNYGYFLNYRYGITIDDYDRMLEEQDGRCAICRTDRPRSGPVADGQVRWSVDHCHDSLKVRGLLCGSCNTGLGYFKDDPIRIRAAADYLEQT